MSGIFTDHRPVTLELELGELRALVLALQTCRTCQDPACDDPIHLVFGYALHSVRHRLARALQAAGVPDDYEDTLRDSRAASTAWLDQRRAALRERGLL